VNGGFEYNRRPGLQRTDARHATLPAIVRAADGFHAIVRKRTEFVRRTDDPCEIVGEPDDRWRELSVCASSGS
jgi:hypothetical protein